MKPKFKAKIVDGKVAPYHPHAMREYYKKFEGQDISISIAKWSSIRSDQQNRYLHGVVFKLIAEETGMTLGDAKKYTKLELGFYETLGEIEGEKVLILKETSKLNKTEFGELVDAARKWAKERLSIHIPLPDDIDFDELYTYDI